MTSSFNNSDDIDPFKHDSPFSSQSSPPPPQQIPLPPDEDEGNGFASPSLDSTPLPPPPSPQHFQQPTSPLPVTSQATQAPNRAYNIRRSSFESTVGRYLQQEGWVIEVSFIWSLPATYRNPLSCSRSLTLLHLHARTDHGRLQD